MTEESKDFDFRLVSANLLFRIAVVVALMPDDERQRFLASVGDAMELVPQAARQWAENHPQLGLALQVLLDLPLEQQEGLEQLRRVFEGMVNEVAEAKRNQ